MYPTEITYLHESHDIRNLTTIKKKNIEYLKSNIIEIMR